MEGGGGGWLPSLRADSALALLRCCSFSVCSSSGGRKSLPRSDLAWGSANLFCRRSPSDLAVGGSRCGKRCLAGDRSPTEEGGGALGGRGVWGSATPATAEAAIITLSTSRIDILTKSCLQKRESSEILHNLQFTELCSRSLTNLSVSPIARAQELTASRQLVAQWLHAARYASP